MSRHWDLANRRDVSYYNPVNLPGGSILPRPRIELTAGSRVAVAGGGPAGSFFSCFLLNLSRRAELPIQVDIFEPKDYTQLGPASCNMCGGIISESLVQVLAAEGINLPNNVVQRGVDAYRLHMDVGAVSIRAALGEKRIAAVHRGPGPHTGTPVRRWDSFDGHLLRLATERGAVRVKERVEGIEWNDGRPVIVTKRGRSAPYDLVAVAVGVNSGAAKLLEKIGGGYDSPEIRKTAISEFWLGSELVEKHFGNCMHVFLLDLPRVEFAALIPKGEYVTAVLLGEDVARGTVQSFLDSEQVRGCFPEGWTLPADHCRCSPSINVKGPSQPFGDRIVFIGDCGESRLYKDGIGGAYRTAKAAAKTAIFEGISAEDFRTHYLPVCRDLAADNFIGKGIFRFTGLIRKARFVRKGMLRLVQKEQQGNLPVPSLDGILWDIFTGSAPYRDVLRRMLHPMLHLRFAVTTLGVLFQRGVEEKFEQEEPRTPELGRIYRAGEVIFRQGDSGDCLYVIQDGKVEVMHERDGHEICFAILEKGESFGEMCMFEDYVRTSTARAVTEVRAITVDRKMLMRKFHEDPSMVYRIMHVMARRVTLLGMEVVRLNIDRVNTARDLIKMSRSGPTL